MVGLRVLQVIHPTEKTIKAQVLETIGKLVKDP